MDPEWWQKNEGEMKEAIEDYVAYMAVHGREGLEPRRLTKMTRRAKGTVRKETAGMG